MDMKTISVLRPLELFEIVNKLQNIITNESGLPQFIQFAKNMEEMRKKWQKAEEKSRELETILNRVNAEKTTLSRQVEELKLDIEMHYEKRIKAESERDKLQKQIEMFKKILDDKQSYTFNDEDRNLLFNTPNFHSNFLYNASKRLSHNAVDETGSLISDYTEDDLDVDINNDDLNTACAAASVAAAAAAASGVKNIETRAPLHSTSRRCIRSRNPTSTTSPKIINTSIGRNTKREKGSLTRQEVSEKKRSRTRSHDPPIREPQQIQTATNSTGGAAITAITTLKISDDGRPITLTSEIQHNNSPNGDSPLEQATHRYESNNGNNKLEVSFVRPKNKKKRPSREFLQRSADESESTDSDVFWSSETATKQNNDRRLLTPIVETPNLMKLSKETLNKQNTTDRLKNVNSSPLISSAAAAKRTRKQHTFKSQVIINGENCAHCDKRTRFGKVVHKCRDCELVVHTECKELLDKPCYLPIVFPIQGTINDYVSTDTPYIPSFLQYIIAEIESKGLGKEVGLYRINGSDQQIKQFKEKLIKRHQLPDLRKINDVHILCGFVKDFLNNLTEHLITYESWQNFSQACDIQNKEDKEQAFQMLVNELPRANRETLAFMILHIQRVSQSPESKMSPSSLACVFGPSIVGNSTLNVSSAQIIHECKIQHNILENLINLPAEFYDNLINSNDVKMLRNAPNTPEVLRKSRTATVLTSLLGPAVNNNNYQLQQQQQQKQELPTSANINRDQNIRNRRNFNSQK